MLKIFGLSTDKIFCKGLLIWVGRLPEKKDMLNFKEIVRILMSSPFYFTLPLTERMNLLKRMERYLGDKNYEKSSFEEGELEKNPPFRPLV